MKNFACSICIMMILTTSLNAQTYKLPNNFSPSDKGHNLYGIKGGINISHISNPSGTGSGSKLGFMLGLLADKSFGQSWGLRNEILYSRDGFHFHKPGATGTVDLQYIYFTALGTINIGRIAQIQAGPQIGYLAKAMADTAFGIFSTDPGKIYSIGEMVKRINYGACLGFEVYPWRGLLIGIRYNTSFSPLDKGRNSNYSPNYNKTVPGITATSKVKNFQLSVGWRFGDGIK